MPAEAESAAIKELIRGRGLRATRSRVAVFAAVSDLPGHPDARRILARVQAGGVSISTQAIYDCLGTLTAVGLLRRFEPAGSPARYEARVGDNHHHVVCRACGATEDVDCATGAAPCLEPGSAAGFAVDEAEVTFWGLCPACQGDAASARDAIAASTRPIEPATS